MRGGSRGVNDEGVSRWGKEGGEAIHELQCREATESEEGYVSSYREYTYGRCMSKKRPIEYLQAPTGLGDLSE